MVEGIILAAGSSRRFGDDKRKAKLPDDQMVIVNTIKIATAVLDSVLVVLRFGDRMFAEELESIIGKSGVSYLLAPDSARGMAHSLSNAIQKVNNPEAVMVFLADMPFVKETTLRALLDVWHDHQDTQPIVIPTSQGTPGHPVIFDRAYFKEIQTLEGDRGARPVVDAHQDKLVTVEVDDSGIFKDIDTQDDLQTGA